MKNYAIVNTDTGEFYADPVYVDKKKAEVKIDYLKNYRLKNNMQFVNYAVELLTPERWTQHNREWAKFVAAID
jgi:hypothetical protein